MTRVRSVPFAASMPKTARYPTIALSKRSPRRSWSNNAIHRSKHFWSMVVSPASGSVEVGSKCRWICATHSSKAMICWGLSWWRSCTRSMEPRFARRNRATPSTLLDSSDKSASAAWWAMVDRTHAGAGGSCWSVPSQTHWSDRRKCRRMRARLGGRCSDIVGQAPARRHHLATAPASPA